VRIRRFGAAALIAALAACAGSGFEQADLTKFAGASSRALQVRDLSAVMPLSDDDKLALRNAGEVAARAPADAAATASGGAIALLFHSDDGAAQALSIVDGAVRRSDGRNTRPTSGIGDQGFIAANGDDAWVGWRRKNVALFVHSSDGQASALSAARAADAAA
jgi:hypothetical protein